MVLACVKLHANLIPKNQPTEFDFPIDLAGYSIGR